MVCHVSACVFVGLCVNILSVNVNLMCVCDLFLLFFRGYLSTKSIN